MTTELTLHDLRAQLAAGRLSPRDLLDDLLRRIERHNPALHAYIALDPERLRRQDLAAGGRLQGLPITVKDNLCIEGEETTCGSRILQGFRAPYDATVIARLRREGAVLIPRANMDEFAFGSSTENSAYGPTKNPWALDRVPGGSSGGPAAAVAAGLAVAALGSDTGGSIRQPASFCGCVGLKPTYGRVSRYGLVAFASSLDQIGPITKDVTDAALLLSVIAGHDPKDSTSAPVPVPDYVGQLNQPVAGLRVGVPKDLPADGLALDVRQRIEDAVGVLSRLGCATVPIELPHLTACVATYYIIATAEASSNLARYDGVQYGRRVNGDPGSERAGGAGGSLLDMLLRTRTEGFGPESIRRILLGTYVLSHGYYDAYYRKAMQVRTLIARDFTQALERCDLILLPTAPTPAFRLGEKLEDPLQMYLSDIFTISANLAGVPALSLPCGFSQDGLPIGLQLIAGPFQEARVLRAGYAYEQATDWHHYRPSLS